MSCPRLKTCGSGQLPTEEGANAEGSEGWRQHPEALEGTRMTTTPIDGQRAAGLWLYGGIHGYLAHKRLPPPRSLR